MAVSDDDDPTPQALFSGPIDLPPAPDFAEFDSWDFMPPSASDKGKGPEANIESPDDAAMLQESGGDNVTQGSSAAIQLELTQRPSESQGFEMMARTASQEALQVTLDARAQKLDEKEAELRALEESVDARQARVDLDRSELQDRANDCMNQEDEVRKRCHEAKEWQRKIFDWQENVARREYQVFHRENQVSHREMVADQRDVIAAANMHAGTSALGVSG